MADDHPALAPGGSKIVKLPGIMSMSDLRGYQARVQAPTHVSYRGLDIYSMAPPSSSGTTQEHERSNEALLGAAVPHS